MLWTASCFAACNLVLGIDDVSSANGPDSGQQISAATAEPHDASIGAGDGGAVGPADAGRAEVDANRAPRSSHRDAGVRGVAGSAAAQARDAAVDDQDAGADSDDGGLPR